MPEIAFIRATGTRLVDETVHRTDAHVFLWRHGGPPIQITRGASEDFDPAWSPDGRTVFFAREREPRGRWIGSEIFRVNAEGGRVTRLTRCRGRSCMGDSQPRVSPDGKTVAFLRMAPGKSRIGLLSLPGRGLSFVALPDQLRPFTSLSWRTSDEVTLSAYGHGTEVRAYESTPELRSLGRLRICKHSSRCSAPGPISWPSDDPAGAGAVEAALADGPAIYPVSDERVTSPTVRCTDGRCPHNPAVSPDGRYLAFDAGGDFGGDLYVTDASGSLTKRITTGDELDCCAAWRSHSP